MMNDFISLGNYLKQKINIEETLTEKNNFIPLFQEWSHNLTYTFPIYTTGKVPHVYYMCDT